jgi:hypothetical protein
MRTGSWAAFIALLLAGCSGEGDRCAAVTCGQGRVCVNGVCVSPDGGAPPVDLAAVDSLIPDVPITPPDSAGPDGEVKDAPSSIDIDPNCPNPAVSAGTYSGTFVDGLGGALANGNLTFTLKASGPGQMALDGTLNGTALPGAGNFKIQGTLSGIVDCDKITAGLSGTIDGYGFNGQLNGTLKGTTASGTWNGVQTGGGLSLNGSWNAARN